MPKICPRFEADHEATYRATGNPLHIWAVIGHRLKARREGGAVTLPAWCADYLEATDSNLSALLNGRDFREPTTTGGYENDGGDGSRKRLTLRQATALMPAAFGLVRDGWNAFERYWSWFAKDVDRENVWHMRRDGMTAEQALEVIRERRGLSDTRAVRRRIAEAKKTLPTIEDET